MDEHGIPIVLDKDLRGDLLQCVKLCQSKHPGSIPYVVENSCNNSDDILLSYNNLIIAAYDKGKLYIYYRWETLSKPYHFTIVLNDISHENGTIIYGRNYFINDRWAGVIQKYFKQIRMIAHEYLDKHLPSDIITIVAEYTLYVGGLSKDHPH